jgi:hypothetical protein
MSIFRNVESRVFSREVLMLDADYSDGSVMLPGLRWVALRPAWRGRGGGHDVSGLT